MNAQSWEDPLPIPDGVNPDQVIIGSDWYVRICHPIVRQMYKRDWHSATRLLQEALCSLALHRMNSEDRERLRLQLMYLEFQMHMGTRSLDRINQILPVIDEVYRSTKTDPVTDFLRRKLRLQINLCLDLMGIRSADPDDTEKLALNESSRYWSFDIWIMMSYWAFSNHNLDLLLHSNNRMIEACDSNPSYAWFIQRNLIMQMLLNGEANEDDLVWLIDSVEIVSQLESIGGRIRIVADEKGLWSRNVANAYSAMQNSLKKTNNTAVDAFYANSVKTAVAS